MPLSFLFNPFTGNFDEISQVAIATSNGLSIDSNQNLSLALATGSSPGAVSNVGTANGVATLDSSGKIPVGQLPSVVMEYQGAWNPNTNSPSLSDGTGTNGNVYYVTAARSSAVSGLTDPSMTNFQIGDLVIYSSSIGKWQLVTPAAGVQSVNGAQGVVTVNAINQLTGDVTTSTASQSQSEAATVAAIQGNTVNGTTGTGNVVFSNAPTFTGTLFANAINASSTIVGANLSGTNTGNVTIGTANGLSLIGQVLSLTTASPSFSGALSATDWNTFNNKQPSGNYITALTGDVAASGPGSASSTIQTNVVSNTKLAQMAANTLKGNNTGSTANASDLTISQVLSLLGISSGNPGDIGPTSFSASNNISSATNVTGLSFSNSTVRQFNASVSIYVNATSSLYEAFNLQGIQNGTGWYMSQTSVGDNSGFSFTITSSGQIQYTNSNYTGFTAATVKFRATTLPV